MDKVCLKVSVKTLRLSRHLAKIEIYEPKVRHSEGRINTDIAIYIGEANMCEGS